MCFLANVLNCANTTSSPAFSPDQGQSPAGKAVYPGGPGTKITSVSTGNLCADVSSSTIEAGGSFVWNAPADQMRLKWHHHSKDTLTISVFTHQDEPSPPRPEAYPIPTQTYPREYFTIPASKSQDRVVGPGQAPSQHWQGMEDRERLPVVDNIHNSMQVEQRVMYQRSLIDVRRGHSQRKNLIKLITLLKTLIHFLEKMVHSK